MRPIDDTAAGAGNAGANQDGDAGAKAEKTAKPATEKKAKGQAKSKEEKDGAAGDGASASAVEATEDNYEDVLRSRLPADLLTNLDGLDPSGELAVLYAEACEVYGVNPDPAGREVISEIVPTAGDEFAHPPIPRRVRFVTAGGLKIVHPMDQLFEEQLRTWLKAFRMNRQTGEREATELPADLTLPREAVTGISTKVEHRFEAGYLRSRALARARSGR